LHKTLLDGPVHGLFRYPVKGLSAERLQTVNLKAGETLPLDRAWAIEAGRRRFDSKAPQHLAKVAFLMLMRNPILASLQTSFDEATNELVVRRKGRELGRGALSTSEGRQQIEACFSTFLGLDGKDTLRVVHAEGHSFSDVPIKCLHILNLASVRALEREIGRPVDAARFRANIVVDLPLPWVEFSWVGQEIRLGSVDLDVLDQTERCAATNAAPGSGERDMDIPATLERAFGHMEMGIYAKITRGGPVSTNDRLSGPAP